MPAGLNAVTVVNSALEQIASRFEITALGDGTTAGNAANTIYVPTVQLMLRELDPDFARTTLALTTAGVTPQVPWAYEYIYPADCIRLRQVRPPASGTGQLVDPNDPQPVRSLVSFDRAAAVPNKVVLTNQQNALAVYTTSSVTETDWDAAFTDTVVRRLANPLAMALSGRPDFAREILEQSVRMAATCEMVDESSFRRL